MLALDNLGVVRSDGEIPTNVFHLRVEFECVVNEDSVLQGIEIVGLKASQCDVGTHVKFTKRLTEDEVQYDLRCMNEASSGIESLMSVLCNEYGRMARVQGFTFTAMDVQNLASARLIRKTSRHTRSRSDMLNLDRSIR